MRFVLYFSKMAELWCARTEPKARVAASGLGPVESPLRHCPTRLCRHLCGKTPSRAAAIIFSMSLQRD